MSLCRVGEGRAYWSLGNAHTALGNHEQAMYFAEKHLEIAKEVTVYCLPPPLESSETPPSAGCMWNSRELAVFSLILHLQHFPFCFQI